MSTLRRAALVAVGLALFPAVTALAGGQPRPTYTITEAGRDAGFSPGAPFMGLSDRNLARDLDAMAASGVQWVRIDFDWSAIQPTGPGSFMWTDVDRVVSAITSRGMSVLALPAYTPGWARPAGSSDHYGPVEHIDDFAAFVGVAAARYAPKGVHTWEIWNEPNGSWFWGPQPDPAAYTQLLEASSAAIKAVDPTAVVLTGGLSPAVDASNGSQLSMSTFLRGIYAAGGAGAFDAVAVHPYSYPALPLQPGTESWNSFLQLPAVYDVMVANGDGAKQMWGTEFGAPTGTSGSAVSEALQSQMVTEAYADWQLWPWTGPLLWYSYRDQGTNLANTEDNFGLVHYDRTPKPAWATFQAVMSPPPPAASTTTTTTAAESTTTTTSPPKGRKPKP